MREQPLLEARNLSVRFGAIVAVDDVSVSVMRGEVVGLIGTNGAGKTTFLNMVTGYLAPTSGDIIFDGERTAGRTPRDMVRHGMARSFQVPQLFSELTVFDHIVLSLALAERPRRPFGHFVDHARMEAVQQVLRQFGLEQLARRPISLIPQGQRKLIDIAMALSLRPKLLLLDEPTSGVSSAEKLSLMDVVFASIRTDDTTVLFVEHDMEIVMRYVTRLLAFRDGRLIADGIPTEVMRDAQVASAIIRHPSHAAEEAS